MLLRMIFHPAVSFQTDDPLYLMQGLLDFCSLSGGWHRKYHLFHTVYKEAVLQNHYHREATTGHPDILREIHPIKAGENQPHRCRNNLYRYGAQFLADLRLFHRNRQKKGRVTMILLMEVKAFPFLMPVGIKQCRIQIQKNNLRVPDGIDNLTELPHDVIKLAKCGVNHTVKKAG